MFSKLLLQIVKTVFGLSEYVLQIPDAGIPTEMCEFLHVILAVLLHIIFKVLA